MFVRLEESFQYQESVEPNMVIFQAVLQLQLTDRLGLGILEYPSLWLLSGTHGGTSQLYSFWNTAKHARGAAVCVLVGLEIEQALSMHQEEIMNETI